MARKCSINILIKTNFGTQTVRCPKNATKFFHLKFGRDFNEEIVGCCDAHSRNRLKPETWEGIYDYAGIRNKPRSVAKSSLIELCELESKQRHDTLLEEFQRMFARKFMKDKSREEILAVFTQALDEHCTKQVLTS